MEGNSAGEASSGVVNRHHLVDQKVKAVNRLHVSIGVVRGCGEDISRPRDGCAIALLVQVNDIAEDVRGLIVGQGDIEPHVEVLQSDLVSDATGGGCILRYLVQRNEIGSRDYAGTCKGAVDELFFAGVGTGTLVKTSGSGDPRDEIRTLPRRGMARAM